jgi:hypothetical protein
MNSSTSVDQKPPVSAARKMVRRYSTAGDANAPVRDFNDAAIPMFTWCSEVRIPVET